MANYGWARVGSMIVLASLGAASAARAETVPMRASLFGGSALGTGESGLGCAEFVFVPGPWFEYGGFYEYSHRSATIATSSAGPVGEENRQATGIVGRFENKGFFFDGRVGLHYTRREQADDLHGLTARAGIGPSFALTDNIKLRLRIGAVLGEFNTSSNRTFWDGTAGLTYGF